MRIAAAAFGGVVATVVAMKLVGFTSAIQSQKTVVLTVILSLVVCPLCYWGAGVIARVIHRK
jgi:hypothetical protein